jgi:integrase
VRKLATIAALGRKRKPGYVRAFKATIEGRDLIRVQWRELDGSAKTESFPDTRKGIAEAKAFADGVHERLTAKAAPVATFAPLTLRQVWEKYVAAHETAWRPKTLQSAADRWRVTELVLGRHTLATAVTPEVLDDLKNQLLKAKTKRRVERSSNQVRSMIDLVTAVFRWAEIRRLLPPSLVPSYRAKLSKEHRRQVVTMHEFRADDRAKVLAALDPRDAHQWRAWALTTLFAYCGPRQTAARHLEWVDVSFTDGLLRWRPETDKMGAERVQPMPEPVREALWVCYGWALAMGYAGRFVFFAVKRGHRTGDEKPYTYQAYVGQLHDAERRAGLEPIAYRGAHGFRRGIAGDVHAATGSEKTAADWIGDKSVKIVRDHYLLGRVDELRKTANLVGANATKHDGPASDGEAGGDNT